MAVELLQTISKDEIERARFRSRRMFRMDMEHNLIAARDEGRDEGRNEGVMAVAKNLLDFGETVDKIIKVTGMTRDEIESLRNAD